MGRSKVLFAALFLFLTVSVVDAYTIVMRDGRRVEIPNKFTVTGSKLTYDVGNGIQVTVQLNTVDIADMRAQEEAYWPGRADALRAENEAQFSSFRQQPGDIPWSYSVGGFGPFDGIGFGITGGSFNRFGRFRPSPFDGFLATPITPFPRFPFSDRRRLFTAPGVRVIPRIVHG